MAKEKAPEGAMRSLLPMGLLLLSIIVVIMGFKIEKAKKDITALISVTAEIVRCVESNNEINQSILEILQHLQLQEQN